MRMQVEQRRSLSRTSSSCLAVCSLVGRRMQLYFSTRKATSNDVEKAWIGFSCRSSKIRISTAVTCKDSELILSLGLECLLRWLVRCSWTRSRSSIKKSRDLLPLIFRSLRCVSCSAEIRMGKWCYLSRKIKCNTKSSVLICVETPNAPFTANFTLIERLFIWQIDTRPSFANVISTNILNIYQLTEEK